METLSNKLGLGEVSQEMVASLSIVSLSYPARYCSSQVMSAPLTSPTLTNTHDPSSRASTPSISSFDQGSWCSISRESCLLDRAELSPAGSGYITDEYNEYMLISEPSKDPDTSPYEGDMRLDYFLGDTNMFIMPSPSTSNHLSGDCKSVCVLRSEQNNLSRLVDISLSAFRAHGLNCIVEVVLLSDQLGSAKVRCENAPTLCLINDGDVRWPKYISGIQRSYSMNQGCDFVIINAVSTNFFANISTLTSACRPSRVWSAPEAGNNKLRSQIADYVSDRLIPANYRAHSRHRPAESDVNRFTTALARKKSKDRQYRYIEDGICMELCDSKSSSDPFNMSPYLEAFCSIRRRVVFPFLQRTIHINSFSRSSIFLFSSQRRAILYWAGLAFFLGLEIGFAISSTMSHFDLFRARTTKEEILATAPTFHAWRKFERLATRILGSMDLE